MTPHTSLRLTPIRPGRVATIEERALQIVAPMLKQLRDFYEASPVWQPRPIPLYPSDLARGHNMLMTVNGVYVDPELFELLGPTFKLAGVDFLTVPGTPVSLELLSFDLPAH